jgi:energy-coupling factor transporter ATP-binding protein EcfA2
MEDLRLHPKMILIILIINSIRGRKEQRKEMQHQILTRPVSLVCLAAPDDATLLLQWETHLLPLKLAGLILFWSEHHLQAGSDRMEQFIAHLDRADCIILLLSAHFFADDDCLTLMQHTLLRQQNTVLIPLLLRPVEWQDSTLGSLPCLPISRVPVTQWSDSNDAFHACVRGLRSLLKLPASLNATPTRSGIRSNTNRERMLRRLRHSYRDLLSQSLQGLAWMKLGLTERPDAVQNTTNLALRIAQQEERPLPLGVSIIQIYEEAGEELLILGEPGAGKSTLLLHLAQHLVAQAEQDEGYLLPVILPLSSWASKRADLEDWMIEQIAQIYDIPRKVSQQWVHDEQILPLLDGLDEMEKAARPACIAAINAYHRTHLTALVVCSRTNEYESAADKQRLALQSSVVVRPLTSEQIETALEGAGEIAAELRIALHEQPALQGLATTPLMLSVLMLAYQGTTVHLGSLDEVALERRVWTDYVCHMVERKGNTRSYSLEQISSWLSWLAHNLHKQNQIVFYLEHVRLDWLPTSMQRLAFWLAIRLPAILLGMLASFFVGWFQGALSDFPSNNPTMTLIQLAILGGFLGGCFSQGGSKRTASATNLSRTRASALQQHIGMVLVSAGVGLAFAFSTRSGQGLTYVVEHELQDSYIYGCIIGLSCWLLLILRPSTSFQQSSIHATKLTQRLRRLLFTVHVWRILLSTIVPGLGIGLSFGLAIGLSYWPPSPSYPLADILSFGLWAGLSYALFFGITFGCVGLLISFVFERNKEYVPLTEGRNYFI